MADNNTVILRVQLDEAQTEKQLQELVLKIEATKKAQADLNAQRKAGAVDDATYAKQVVDLRTQLTGQQQAQRGLTKDLELYRAAQNGQVDSYKATQAALSLAIRQQQELAGSADNSSEASQALTRQIDQYRETLKATDAQQGAFFRNIGNYPKGENLESLVQQLVKLQEETKGLAAGTEEASRAQMRIVGFQTQAAQAGAKEGKSYEETTNFVREYGEAIRPATAALVQLSQQQQQAAESGEATGEAMAQIGFKIGAAQKSIKDATDALKEVPAAASKSAKETKGFSGALLDAADSSGLLSGVIDKVKAAQDGYTQAQTVARAATAASTTSLGALRVALIATGLGALVVLLGSVIAFLTKTQAGTDLLSRKLAAFGAVVTLITNKAADFGETLVKAADDPKKAFSDLLDFIGNNILNRFKALGVAIDAIRNRDLGKLADSLIQFQTGIVDASAKTKAFAAEVNAAAAAGERLAQMERELSRAQNDNIATNKTLLNEVERLKNVRDNEFNSIQVRKKANEDAYRVELQREKELTKIAQQQIDVLAKKLELEGGRSRNEELFAELQRARNELKDIQEDAAGKQNELITNRYQLEQERIDKSIERRAQAVALDIALLNKQLAQVQVNSEKELSLRQQLLNNGRAAELNVKNLTVAQKRAIDVKYETDSLALSLDFQRRRLQAAIAAEIDLTSARLTQQQAGSADELRLQTEQIENQRKLALAGLVANADNTAKIAAINAQAEQQRRQLEFQQATRDLQAYLDEKRRIVEADYASGAIQEAEYQRRLAAISKAGTDAQAVVNQDYRQSNVENQKQANADETDAIRRHAAEVKQTEEAKQQVKQATVQAFQAGTDAIIAAFGEESAAGQAALVLKKTLALAEIAMGLEKQFAANAETGAKISAIAPPFTTPIGIAYTIATDAAAVIAAAQSVANINKLRRGGLIADGPSHEQGGIQLYRNGRHAGIEIEGGEVVMTRSVSANPLLLSLASTVNQLAGGRALVPNFPMPHMALGGVAPTLILDQLRGDAGQINSAAIGKAVADSFRKNPPVNRWVDFKQAEARNTFTNSGSNS